MYMNSCMYMYMYMYLSFDIQYIINPRARMRSEGLL